MADGDFAAPDPLLRCYRLEVGADLFARLVWIDQDGTETPCERLQPDLWLMVRDTASEAFVPRMTAKGLPPGRFPDGPGAVHLAKPIGEELGSLMACAAERRDTIPRWTAATPEWRRKLWHMVAPLWLVITIQERLRASPYEDPEKARPWMIRAIREKDATGQRVVPFSPGRSETCDKRTEFEKRRGHEQMTRRQQLAMEKAERRRKAIARSKAKRKAKKEAAK